MADLDDIREQAKEPLHKALHELDVRIANVPADGCHCNLVAEVALDALAPTLAALAEVQRERDELRRKYDESLDVLDSVRASLALVGENFDKVDAEAERMRPVVEKAQRWRGGRDPATSGMEYHRRCKELESAVDTYETQVSSTDG